MQPRKIKDRLTLREATLIESPVGPAGRSGGVQRNYSGDVAAHLLGYVGEASADQLKTGFRRSPPRQHRRTIWSRKWFDRQVRGRAGQKSVEVDALGHEKRAIVSDKAGAGDDLYLTIDAKKLQKTAEDLLGRNQAPSSRLDPTNGDIFGDGQPSRDPATLSKELTNKQWVEIVQNERRPLNNRATQGTISPD